MRNDMEKKVDILMKKLLRLGNSEKAISLRQRLLEEVDWLENEAVYCDEVDIEEHVAVFQDIEGSLNCSVCLTQSFLSLSVNVLARYR